MVQVQPIKSLLRVDHYRSSLVMITGLLIFLCCFLTTNAHQTPKLQEYEAKALLLYNFAKSTSWPEGSFKQKNSPIVVGVVGSLKIFNAFKVYNNKLANGRPLKFERLEFITDFKTGHILFITTEWTASAKLFIENLSQSKKPILTVGESQEFVLNGGMISIVQENNHLALLTNPNATKNANLFLNRNLIKLSRQISRQEDNQ
jgi:hypothetical protein